MGSNPASPTITVEAMCGRFVGSYRVEDLLDEIGDAVSAAGLNCVLPTTNLALSENFNVAPTQIVPVLVRRDAEIHLEVMQWGLVPSWSKDSKIGAKMINARAETLTEKVSFRSLVAGHRCVVPMNGFYEWQRLGSRPKVPYFVHRKDGRLMMVAGLWSRSAIVDNEFTFTTITRDSGGDLSEIHDRTPAHFTVEVMCDWLLGDIGPESLGDTTLQPLLSYHEVSVEVNSVRNNRRELIEPFENISAETKTSKSKTKNDEGEHPRLF